MASKKQIKLVSLNVRGIGAVNKRRKLFTWLQSQNADIIFLQETHCNKLKHDQFVNSWSGKSFYGHTDSAHSRGVGILFNAKSKVDINVEDKHYTDDGRTLLLNVIIEGDMYTLVNVYAPNDINERSEYFTNISEWILYHSNNINNLIIAGDFNCCLLDNDRSTKTHLSDKSRKSMVNLLNKLDLSDIWELSNSTNGKTHYTWQDHTTSSRLDYFLTSKGTTVEIRNILSKTVITDKIGKRLTDHKALIVNINICTPKRGPGYWKLNTNLLCNEVYCQDISKIIQNVNRDETLMGVSKRVKWDILKIRIKECSIKASVRLSIKRKKEQELLEDELHILENKRKLNVNDLQRKEEITNRLDEIYTNISEGAKLRAKIESVNEVECNVKLFKNIEGSRQHKNVIKCLVNDDKKDVTNQSDILTMIGTFYEKLYKSANVNIDDIKELLNTINFDNILTDDQKNYLDQTPSLEEFDNIIQFPKENKSPGLDGLPIEFYRKFWKDLRLIYFEMIQDSWEQLLLPVSTRTAVLSTIYKSDNDKILANYRPLSLTNCDYKLITFLFANRLNKVMSSIINSDQVAYVKDRYIGTSIRNIIDIYEYCENFEKPGAFICMDMEKAFDSLEHDFIRQVLHKFNFGNNFVTWFNILYTDARFKVKNNGYISKYYSMQRGLRQGCALSALIFIIASEALSSMIRQNENVKGININNRQHKVIQYADDMTVCVNDISSVGHVIDNVKNFGKCSGLKLNFKKTKGIWLGPLKDLGYRVCAGVTFTGKPVKCLGVYIGHDLEKCYQLNWKNKIKKIEKLLFQWSKRKLSLFGKVEVIKTHIISKFVFIASVMDVPSEISAELKSLVHYFIWGKRDRVKRKNIIRQKCKGGLNMLDIDNFFLSLKAAWATRLMYGEGKWSDVFKWYIGRTFMPFDYVWKLSFRKIENFPLLKMLPTFYQQILLAFNKCKLIKPFDLLNKHDIMQQPIWGNEYFKVKDICLYNKGWVKNQVLYVKDLINDKGMLKSDTDLFDCNPEKHNIVQSVYVLKNYVYKKIKGFDLCIAPYVKIRNLTYIVVDNKYVDIKNMKSKMYYNILLKHITSRGNMESIFAREFNFENTVNNWKKVYYQKMYLRIPKLNEFNYKILHNILPCGKILCKFKDNISNLCEYCSQVETTKHMLYECPRIYKLWKMISGELNINISWKNIVCGFIMYDPSPRIILLNYIISIVCYAIFKENSHCKFDKLCYKDTNINIIVKENLMYYEKILFKCDNQIRDLLNIEGVYNACTKL